MKVYKKLTTGDVVSEVTIEGDYEEVLAFYVETLQDVEVDKEENL